MVMTERPRPVVELSALFKGDNAKLLQGKTPEQIRFLKSVVEVRARRNNGDKDALNKFRKDLHAKEMANGLGKELAVIHKAVAIPIDRDLFMKNVLDMHGEIKLGEVNNPEGTF